MKILVFGGTGAMGVPLVNVLAELGYDVAVTSRNTHQSKEKIRYIQGNAKDESFLKSLFQQYWDVVIDFMFYSTREFESRMNMLLSNTNQYIFISSARVYAEEKNIITEDTPRLLDVSDDKEYLETDEYALAKARCEDILRQAKMQNWTIIRPSITYNRDRLQLGVLEKENWLYRALKGRKIVFSRDIADKLTTMTWGDDVTKGILAVIGNNNALGEIYHVVAHNSYTWNDILKIYCEVLEEETGKQPQVVMTDKSTCFKVNWNKYQIIYCRYYDRTFDSGKIGKLVDVESFLDAKDGLRQCLKDFLNDPSFLRINWHLEGTNDRITREWAKVSEFESLKNMMIYLVYRLGLGDMYRLLKGLLLLFR